jgi:TetR/AcrR family transcriptional repressor of mexJK operon
MMHLSGSSPDPSLNSDELKTHFLKMKAKNVQLHADILQKSMEKIEKVMNILISHYLYLVH